MGWKPPQESPSFVKFLIHPDFDDYLAIPPMFVSKYNLQGGGKSAILMTYDSAKSWSVRIKGMGGGTGRYCFKLGWSEFSQDNHLETGDFLLFWLIGVHESTTTTFLVAIYSPSGILKNIPPTVSVSVKEDGDAKQLPSFEFIIKKTSNYRLHLPSSFVEETGIGATRMRSMALINAAGREWPVKIIRQNNRVYVVTSGWSLFQKANNLRIGDKCFLHFLGNQNNIIYVKVLVLNTKLAPPKQGQYRIGKMEEERDTLYFKATLGRSSNYLMGLPIWFVRQSGLATRRNIVLKDASGCEYRVKIRKRRNHGYDIGTGWAGFRRAINIEKGDTCLFEFFRDEGNVIRVKVLGRKGRNRLLSRGARPLAQLKKVPPPR